MRIYRSLAEAREADIKGTATTLGVFDGVHVGHRFVIRECMSLASEMGLESLVVTFEQHPRALLAGAAPKLVTPIEQRLHLFADLGVDHCLVLAFDADLQGMTATEFAHSVFEETLRAQIVVLGHNCRFGKNREGSAEFLLENADLFKFEIRHAPEIRIGQTILSSTNIRLAIEKGDLELASMMLGRPFSLFGTVIHGDKRGRTIGFPTANMDLHHGLLPPDGVYGCRIELQDQVFNALCNIGTRPTFEAANAQRTVEAHVLDFSGDLYDRDLELRFLTRIRGERRFDGVASLKAQIESDRETFLSYLAKGQASG